MVLKSIIKAVDRRGGKNPETPVSEFLIKSCGRREKSGGRREGSFGRELQDCVPGREQTGVVWVGGGQKRWCESGPMETAFPTTVQPET